MPKFSHTLSGRRSARRVKSWSAEDEYLLLAQPSRLVLDEDLIPNPIATPEFVQLGPESRQRLRAELFGYRPAQPGAIHTTATARMPQQAMAAARPISGDTNAVVDFKTAVVILTELKKTATMEELVALHRALLPDQPSAPESNMQSSYYSRNAPVVDAEMRRKRSLFRPGEATRAQSELSSSRSLEKHTNSSHTARARTVSDSTNLSLLGIPRPVIPRVATPSDLGRTYLGNYKLGSLRITNGTASPQPGLTIDRVLSNTGMEKDDNSFTASEGSVKASPPRLKIVVPGRQDCDAQNWDDDTPKQQLGNERPMPSISEVNKGLTPMFSDDHGRLLPQQSPTVERKITLDTIKSDYSFSPSASSGAAVRSDLDDPFISPPQHPQALSLSKTEPVSEGGDTGDPYGNIEEPWMHTVNTHYMTENWTSVETDLDDYQGHAAAPDKENLLSVDRSSSAVSSLLIRAEQMDRAHSVSPLKVEPASPRDSGYGQEAYLHHYRNVDQDESLADFFEPDLSGLENTQRHSGEFVPVSLHPDLDHLAVNNGEFPSVSRLKTPASTAEKPLPPPPSSSQLMPQINSQAKANDARHTQRLSLSPNFKSSNQEQIRQLQRTPKKLQKKRPVSDRMRSAPIIVQRARTVTECPHLPGEVISQHSQRLSSNPGLDSLAKTYKSIADSGSRESVLSFEIFPPIQYKFPSPNPSVEDLSTTSIRQSTGCGLFCLRNKRRTGSNELLLSEGQPMNITALEDACTLTIASPYDSAFRGGSCRRIPSGPRAMRPSCPTGRPLLRLPIKGMSEKDAVELAIARSRDRLIDPEQHMPESPVVDEAEIISPGVPSQRESEHDIIPPVPALSVRPRSRQKSNEMVSSPTRAIVEDVKEQYSGTVADIQPSPEVTSNALEYVMTPPQDSPAPEPVQSQHYYDGSLQHSPAPERVHSQHYDGSMLNRPRPNGRRTTVGGEEARKQMLIGCDTESLASLHMVGTIRATQRSASHMPTLSLPTMGPISSQVDNSFNAPGAASSTALPTASLPPATSPPSQILRSPRATLAVTIPATQSNKPASPPATTKPGAPSKPRISRPQTPYHIPLNPFNCPPQLPPPPHTTPYAISSASQTPEPSPAQLPNISHSAKTPATTSSRAAPPPPSEPKSLLPATGVPTSRISSISSTQEMEIDTAYHGRPVSPMSPISPTPLLSAVAHQASPPPPPLHGTRQRAASYLLPPSQRLIINSPAQQSTLQSNGRGLPQWRSQSASFAQVQGDRCDFNYDYEYNTLTAHGRGVGRGEMGADNVAALLRGAR